MTYEVSSKPKKFKLVAADKGNLYWEVTLENDDVIEVCTEAPEKAGFVGRPRFVVRK